jgi:amino acid transporter
MYEKLTAGKFLIGFVLFFVYAIVIYGFAIKFGNTPISKRKERRKQDIFYQCIVFCPIVILFIYISEKTVFSLIVPVAIVMLFYEFVIQRPRLNRYIAQSEALYKTLILKSQDERYSFYPEKATIALHWDMPKYIKGNLYDLQIDRVCKNEYG